MLREGKNYQNDTGFPGKREEMKNGGRREEGKKKEVERGERAIGAIATGPLDLHVAQEQDSSGSCTKKRASRYQQGHGGVFSAMHRGP